MRTPYSGDSACVSGNRVVLVGRLNWSAVDSIRRKLYAVTVLGGCSHVILDLSHVQRAYPNGVLPIVAEITRLRNAGITVEVLPPTHEEMRSIFSSLGWLHHMDPAQGDPPRLDGPRSLALQSFSDDEELNDIVNRAVETCLQQLVFAEGVPQAFEWVLNEIAGNVLVHSGCSKGWMQVVTYRENHSLALVVCDSGLGIPATMRRSFEFKTDVASLELAMRQGVTSTPAHGQGNGLAGAVAIAQHSKGHLSLVSGRGRVVVSQGRIEPQQQFPGYLGTCVEMQFSTDLAIDLPKALWGHRPTDYMELKFEDDKGELVFRLRDYATSFGNRITGERIRNLVMNLIVQNPGHAVRIVMEDISVISSSFADELFGKLMVDMGPVDYSRLVKLEAIEPICKSILEVAIFQRIAQRMGPDFRGVPPQGGARVV